MIRQETLLVMLVQLVDRLVPPSQAKVRGRGRPSVYSDRLFVKALVIMIVRHLRTVHELLAVLEQPTAEMQTLRVLLCEEGRFPSRRTWERRFKHLPAHLPALIGSLGRSLVELIAPWQTEGRAVAIDSTMLRARGGQWHQKHREQGIVPHTSIDQEAHWTKSGWHGWISGWKLHLVSAVAAVWIPLATELTAANTPDSDLACALLRELPAQVHCVLGDRHYNRDEVRALCTQEGRVLVTTKYGHSPHPDDGVEVRRIFHKLRSVAIENFHEHFKGIFDGHGQVPTKGLLATQRFALGAVFVYQLALWYRFEQHLDLCLGLKAFLKSA